VGNIGGFELIVQDMSENRGLDELDKATRALVDGAGKDERLHGVYTTLAAAAPVVNVEVDRERAKVLGVPIDQIYGALQLFMGSQYVNDFNHANRTYRVYLQAAAPFRDSPDDIGSYYVRSDAGQLIPLEAFARVTTESAPQLIRHYNLFRAAEVNGKGAPGVSSGQAMAAVEELAAGTLPEGMAFGWTGLSREEKESGSQTLLILALGLAFVFLVLAAQYESFRLPFVIILAVPLAVLGGLGLQLLRGLTNDVFCQVGLVMLIGLAAKNAILIVEFAEQKRRQGVPALDAVVQAASLRLRPILMTSIAFLLGVAPLLFASGAGAGARTSIGTVVFGGMLVSMLVNLLFTPGLYLVVRGRGESGPGSGRPSGKHEDIYVA
jgi:HAE1 family hydrophobic/amphiphilic exporter-1